MEEIEHSGPYIGWGRRGIRAPPPLSEKVNTFSETKMKRRMRKGNERKKKKIKAEETVATNFVSNVQQSAIAPKIEIFYVFN